MNINCTIIEEPIAAAEAAVGMKEGYSRIVVTHGDIPVLVSATYNERGSSAGSAMYAALCESVFGFPCTVVREEWRDGEWQIMSSWRVEE